MQNSNSAPNWTQINDCLEELDMLEDYANPKQMQIISILREKTQKCKNLKQRLEHDEVLLKTEYMGLLVEKTAYTNQLQNVYQIGNKLDWQVEVLARIKPLIDSTKLRLIDPKSNKTAQNPRNNK